MDLDVKIKALTLGAVFLVVSFYIEIKCILISIFSSRNI